MRATALLVILWLAAGASPRADDAPAPLAAPAPAVDPGPVVASAPAPTAVGKLDIVFDLESSLLQAVPASKARHYAAANVITVSGHPYVIADGARATINRLLRDPRVRISIASDRPAGETQAILEAFTLGGAANRSLAKVATRVVTAPDPTAALGQACPDLARCWLVTDDSRPALPKSKDPTGSPGHVIRTGPDYYAFDSYADAAGARPKNGRADAIPPDEAAWRLHQHRMDGVYHQLGAALAASDPAKLGADLPAATGDGESAGAKELARAPRWKIADGAVQGCVEAGPAASDPETEVDAAICRNELPAKLAWGGDGGGQCVSRTADGAATIGPVDAAACIATLPVRYFWANQALDRCGVFTADGAFIQDAPLARCTVNVVCDVNTGVLSSFVKDLARGPVFKALKDMAAADQLGCDQTERFATADDSPSKAYFQSVLNKGHAATLSDLLHLWYPDRPVDPTGGAYYFSCQKAPWGNLDVPGHHIPSACTPDAIYSWGPRVKLDTLEKTMADGEAWHGIPNPGGGIKEGTVFASNSPVSTFMYGPIIARFKIKPGTNFWITGFGGEKGAVTYRQGTYQDFSIQDSSVVENWSYDTPELYDEIVRDALQISSGHRATRYVAGAPTGTGFARIFSQGNVNSHPGDEATLRSRLMNMIKEILAGRGRVVYNRGSCRNRERTYTTTKPSYLDPPAKRP